MADGQLDERIDPGNREAFEALYLRHGPAIRGFLRQYLGDARAADDVVQETFLEIWKKPQGFDPARGSLRQYLFGVARNRAGQWRRDNPSPFDAGASPASDRLSASGHGPAHSRATGDTVAIRHALGQLSGDDRALLWLREVEGYAYAELVVWLDVPLGTVKSRLFNARAALRRVWLGEGSPRAKVR